MSRYSIGRKKIRPREHANGSPIELSKAQIAYKAFIESRKARREEIQKLRASKPKHRRRGCSSCG